MSKKTIILIILSIVLTAFSCVITGKVKHFSILDEKYEICPVGKNTIIPYRDKITGKYGFVVNSSELLVKYDAIYDDVCDNGTMLLQVKKDGLIGLMDLKRGHLVLDCKYTDIKPINDSVALVSSGGRTEKITFKNDW